ncbi:glycosyltransferase family 4 protein [Imperialibacter roseus]|uniref:Glycosyltransferase family 4 protein n=1 Tax=Imperialibacter roseus TaxID=1324217 RepID=A0ABZ0IMM3_9BACT|nr:glycosyltransferase family 4 protein [Imperialibacter roseus]WOK06270.1 glycosyltransferase family 4 protein [Imperialibacter roseus]
MKERKSIFLVVNVDWFFLSHRLSLANFLRKEGYNVAVLCNDTGKMEIIRNQGFECFNINFGRGINGGFSEIYSFIQLIWHFITKRPSIVHNFGLKVITISSLAARITKVPKVINTFTGLGMQFMHPGDNFTKRILRFSLKHDLKDSNIVLQFQNNDDLAEIKLLLGKEGRSDKFVCIDGSGIDLNIYKFHALPSNPVPRFLFASRLLKSKGTLLFLEAAKSILSENIKAEFVVFGDIDKENSDSVEESDLLKFKDISGLKILGHTNQLMNEIISSHIVVLPSKYREGIPKVLIEACAIGRPIITTNSFGCREAVNNDLNGVLLNNCEVEDLVNAMRLMIQNIGTLPEMGKESHLLAENRFDERIIFKKTVEMYQ